MREIKFRVWNKLRNCFIDCEFLYIDTAGKVVTAADNNDNHYSIDREKVVIMQYTGLKDKNGVEIYEGDIVKYNNQVKGATPKWRGPVAIEWRDDKARFDWHEDWRDGWSYDGMIYCAYEVIGNIYKSPALLEKQA